MWRMTPRLAIAALTATLALAAPTTPQARASAVQSYTYSTTTSLGDINIGPIALSGQSGGTLTTPGSVVLGTFSTAPLPSTATLTYDHTPFTIDLLVSAQGSGPGAPFYDYKIQGMLNGSITNGSSSMVATVTSITGSGSGLDEPPFPIDALQFTLPQGIAAPNGYASGITSLIAQVNVAGNPLPPAAPEPTSVAAFAVAIVGWGLRRRLRPRA